ncbi:FAD-dependent monooxygenase [Tropicibacter naphthalenivorans]|uniref:3-hydroxybenzoate 6-hydroxylase 1 n=1 Tax=Tropicibacter naphthalenivorans TaxID=441103 RepID=A0A0P1GZI7_9RHOB|nr:FAD-dependent monooxygenase [Tropicibacter naphthalenivorans]CUH80375.1 3-hydroxybenzoate 6-hydroxylase 1 [Tropicibacter naphthalenivorans]SMC86022.1 salicylate hydroxylase [Tropicibacter naphthalenivorans]
MSLNGRNITIVGGGIGGLACALALRARGAEVRVLEQAEAIREVGAGIQVSPNGLRVIEALGLGEAFRDVSVAGQAVSLRDYRAGREVLRLDLTKLPSAQSYRFVHRADLIDLLAGAARAAGVSIRLLQKVCSVEPGPVPVVHLCNGDTVHSDQIICADGLHSVLRPLLNGAAQPFFTGQVAWRAVVPNRVNHPSEARVHMGPGRHMVTYPLRGGEMVNIVAVEERAAWADEGWSHQDDPANLRRAFASFGGMVPDLLAGVAHPGLWGLFRHPVAEIWHGENVALLGDAAHPTLPFLAQGANMALEDAWVLAAQLDGPSGLPGYQALRRPRVSRAIDAANGNAWKYHLRNPLIRGVAHLGLGMIGRIAPDKMLHQFDWLYAHDVTAPTA